jgi:hypothetical protein
MLVKDAYADIKKNESNEFYEIADQLKSKIVTKMREKGLILFNDLMKY